MMAVPQLTEQAFLGNLFKIQKTNSAMTASGTIQGITKSFILIGPVVWPAISTRQTHRQTSATIE